MALAIGAVLALLAIMVAAYPFLLNRRSREGGNLDRPRQSDAGSESPAAPEAGPDQLDTIYEAIRTLHLEREIGNIPEGLYREQLNLYRRQAALLLRDYDREQGGNLDWALEEEVKVARAALNTRHPSAGRNPDPTRRSREGGDLDADSASANPTQSSPEDGC